ncbi:hypothetical protein [Allomuricauda sp.]|nr:hypothetical protein [Allomuricauda sp.]
MRTNIHEGFPVILSRAKNLFLDTNYTNVHKGIAVDSASSAE